MISGNVIDEVGFEQDTFTANVQVKQHPARNARYFEVVRIIRSTRRIATLDLVVYDDACLGFSTACRNRAGSEP